MWGVSSSVNSLLVFEFVYVLFCFVALDGNALTNMVLPTSLVAISEFALSYTALQTAIIPT